MKQTAFKTTNPVLNKKGITMIELVAYTALIGIVVTLFGSLLRYVTISYDRINGQGAITNEANNIMSLIMTHTNTLKPDYAFDCSESGVNSCVALVNKDDITINEYGIIEYVENTKTNQIYIKDQQLYINQMQITNDKFRIDTIDHESTIQIECAESSSDISGACQKPVISFNLWIVRVRNNGDYASEPKEYISRISFN
jgi:hypothetical protein